jgi:hypothetical protein
MEANGRCCESPRSRFLAFLLLFLLTGRDWGGGDGRELN